MAGPFVSVIIPTYNRAHFLNEAVRSVLDQTFTDFEIIVVDDGSTDHTGDLVRTFLDTRIRYIHQAHRGINASMNTGLRAARGAYIGRLDSDDVWLPEMLVSEVEALNRHADVGAVYGRAQAMDETGRPLPNTRGLPQRYPDSSFVSMLYEDFTSSVTLLVRRECFDHIGLYDESLTTAGDWNICLRIARHYSFFFVDQVVARFRLHQGNISGPSSVYFADSLQNRERLLNEVFAASDLPEAAVAIKPIAYRNVYTYVGLQWLRVRQFRRALNSFALALHTGANAATTLTRILWFVLCWEVFNRYELGRRFVDSATNLQHHFRKRRRPMHST